MKKKLAAVALAVALVSLAVPALAFAGGYGQAADGARQGRGACFALCQATEALGGSMADLATTAAAHCGRGCFDGAQNRSQGAGCAASCNGYVDADGDGVCDSCGGFAASGDGGRGSCPGYADADGNGVCDACGNAAGSCGGYVDQDGDGVCDRYGQGGCGKGYGSGHGMGHGYGCRR